MNLKHDILNINSSGSIGGETLIGFDASSNEKELILSGVSKISINNTSDVNFKINNNNYKEVSLSPYIPEAKVLATQDSLLFFQNLANLAQYSSAEELVSVVNQNSIYVQGLEFSPQQIELNGEVKTILVAN